MRWAGALGLALCLVNCSKLLGLEDGKTQGSCSTDAECAPGYQCSMGTCCIGAQCSPDLTGGTTSTSGGHSGSAAGGSEVVAGGPQQRGRLGR